jgi:integrase
MTRGARKRIARNIYADAHGVAIVVERHGTRQEVRFPRGTDPATLRAARDDLIDRLELGHRAQARGTLAADAAAVLETLPTGRHRANMRVLLDHWTAAHGTTPRHALTPVDVRTTLAQFSARFAPEYVRKLRRALGWLFSTLNGPDGQNPVRAVKAPSVRYDDPRGIAFDVLAWIFQHAPDRGRPKDGIRPAVNLSKLRAQAMAYTGMHQIEIGRLRPADIDTARRRVWIHPRQKGSGAPGVWMELIPPAVDALQALQAANGLGRFDTRGLARSWRRWLTTARAAWETDPTRGPWPVHDDARPYDLRHSFGTAVYLATGDIRAAQAMLRHRQVSTAVRYTHAGVSARMSAAREALERLTVPQTSATDPPGSVTKRPPMARAEAPKAKRAARKRKAGST